MNTMHRLCSFEYLESYYFYALRTTVIPLDEALTHAEFRDIPIGPASNDYKVNAMDAAKLYLHLTGIKQADLAPDDKMKNPMVPKMATSGVFAGDESPFLRGKTLDSSRTHSRKEGRAGFVSIDVGDKLAFEKLESLLKDKGFMDWMPDGICHSKLDSGEGSAPGIDDHFDARDGQLFNITISGSSISTTWSDDSSMACLPLDKVFIVIVADLYNMNETDLEKEEAYKALVNASTPSGSMADYETAFKRAIGDAPTKESIKKTFESAGNQCLTNFQIKRMTSSQIVNYSKYAPASQSSRLGMPVGQNGGRYIVGGWCLGTVTDCAAASAVREYGALMGTGTKRKSSGYALGVMVNVQWWSGDQLYRKFCDRPTAGDAPNRGIIRSRYDAFAQIPAELAEPLSRRTEPKPEKSNTAQPLEAP